MKAEASISRASRTLDTTNLATCQIDTDWPDEESWWPVSSTNYERSVSLSLSISFVLEYVGILGTFDTYPSSFLVKSNTESKPQKGSPWLVYVFQLSLHWVQHLPMSPSSRQSMGVQEQHISKSKCKDNECRGYNGYHQWLLLGWATAERSCPCKQPACPAIGGGSEVIFKSLVPSISPQGGCNMDNDRRGPPTSTLPILNISPKAVVLRDCRRQKRSVYSNNKGGGLHKNITVGSRTFGHTHSKLPLGVFAAIFSVNHPPPQVEDGRQCGSYR
ncbi:hypothetical protein J6590_056979 [Homalodisca vitripennis]|nr:hypothetical protein J6590_056979 [Homalodisca vitripennis]